MSQPSQTGSAHSPPAGGGGGGARVRGKEAPSKLLEELKVLATAVPFDDAVRERVESEFRNNAESKVAKEIGELMQTAVGLECEREVAGLYKRITQGTLYPAHGKVKDINAKVNETEAAMASEEQREAATAHFVELREAVVRALHDDMNRLVTETDDLKNKLMRTADAAEDSAVRFELCVLLNFMDYFFPPALEPKPRQTIELVNLHKSCFKKRKEDPNSPRFAWSYHAYTPEQFRALAVDLWSVKADTKDTKRKNPNGDSDRQPKRRKMDASSPGGGSTPRAPALPNHSAHPTPHTYSPMHTPGLDAAGAGGQSAVQMGGAATAMIRSAPTAVAQLPRAAVAGTGAGATTGAASPLLGASSAPGTPGLASVPSLPAAPGTPTRGSGAVDEAVAAGGSGVGAAGADAPLDGGGDFNDVLTGSGVNTEEESMKLYDGMPSSGSSMFRTNVASFVQFVDDDVLRQKMDRIAHKNGLREMTRKEVRVCVSEALRWHMKNLLEKLIAVNEHRSEILATKFEVEIKDDVLKQMQTLRSKIMEFSKREEEIEKEEKEIAAAAAAAAAGGVGKNADSKKKESKIGGDDSGQKTESAIQHAIGYRRKRKTDVSNLATQLVRFPPGDPRTRLRSKLTNKDLLFLLDHDPDLSMRSSQLKIRSQTFRLSEQR